MHAVDVGQDRDTSGNPHAVRFIVIEGEAINHPEGGVESHDLVENGECEAELVEAFKRDRAGSEHGIELGPHSFKHHGVSPQQVERPGECHGRSLVAGNKQLHDLDQYLLQSPPDTFPLRGMKQEL